METFQSGIVHINTWKSDSKHAREYRLSRDWLESTPAHDIISTQEGAPWRRPEHPEWRESSGRWGAGTPRETGGGTGREGTAHRTRRDACLRGASSCPWERWSGWSSGRSCRPPAACQSDPQGPRSSSQRGARGGGGRSGEEDGAPHFPLHKHLPE